MKMQLIFLITFLVFCRFQIINTTHHIIFKKLSGLEDYHQNFASVYISSLVKIGKFREAYRYAKNLELKNIDYFNSNLIIGTYYIKNKNLKKAKIYFEKKIRKLKILLFLTK